MKRRTEKLLDAYRDGALAPRKRERVEQWMRGEAGARERIEQIDGIGRAIRVAWTDAPPAPAPEYLIAALRPELARIDDELAGDGMLRRLSGWLSELFRPLPAAALVGACALALFALLPIDAAQPNIPGLAQKFQIRAGRSVTASPFYDLAQGDRPLLIFEGADGATVIWVLDDPDQLSFASDSDGWA
jgi:anti-sigma factor RsiW